ncbi:Vacuolar fusion protein MON1 [Pseudozyma hubeiensis]|nr:Vacuolar fusion protein MON1 [Pseudozyma hubeiensis]
MPQSPARPSTSKDVTALEDSKQASSSTHGSAKPSSPRPTALLTKSWTSASVLPSATSSRITVGANTSTAADASSSRSQPTSQGSSSASTRTSTPLPELSFSPSTPQFAAQETFSGADQLAVPSVGTSSRSVSRQTSDRSESPGTFDDAAQDEPEAVGITASSSIHALDLLHRVNDRAAADRASHTRSLRSRLSQLSIGRASGRNRSRSNSRDASIHTRGLPPEFLETNQPSLSAEGAVQSQAPPAQPLGQSQPGQNKAGAALSEHEEQYPDRKYYILSSAGKPIYISHASLSRRRRRHEQRRQQQQASSKQTGSTDEPLARHDNGNESDEEDESSTTQVGVMQALISIFADEDSDKLRFIRQGDLLITFLLRAPLYLVCVSSWNEEPSTLRQHLEYLYLQVISLVSASQLTRLFSRMPNFDLRRLLEGTEGIFDYLVNQLNANEAEDDGAEVEGSAHKRPVTDWASCHQWWLQALQPIRITVPNLRDHLTAALQPPTAESGSSHALPHRPRDLLYVLLCANGRIVTLLRPRKHAVHPIDLLLLTNTVMGSRSIKRSGGSEEAEIWLPFSMPKFAPQGFVHAYVKFLNPESWVSTEQTGSEPAREGSMSSSELAVIVVTGDKDAFPTVSNWVSSLVARPPAAASKNNASDAASIKSTESTSRKQTSKIRSASKSLKPSRSASTGENLPSWLTNFQRHMLTLCRHLTDPLNVEDGSPRVSTYTCAELNLPGLRHFVYRSNSTIQLTSPTLPAPYATSPSDRKRLFTLYSLVHHHIHHPVPPSTSPPPGENITTSNPTTPAAAAVASTTGMLDGVFGSATLSRPLLNADRRLKMHLVKTENEQVLGWITSPFELYLCLNPQLSKSAIVAVANGLTKWIKLNEKDLFLVNAGSF